MEATDNTGALLEATTTSKRSSKLLATGFALFAMFFGAGNMVFPLFLGAHAGQFIFPVALLFIFIGVGTPLLGLVAMSLFNGDYWDFFNRLGKIPAFLLITFIILIIGPLSAAPRTEIITYQSLLPFLPHTIANPISFSLIFCLVTFCCAYRETKVIDIIGYHITPIKLLCFSGLILLSIFVTGNISHQTPHSSPHIIMTSINMAYGTMDMLGAFFFSTIAVTALKSRLTTEEARDTSVLTKRLLKACLVAGTLLGTIYMGFMFAAFKHATQLQGLRPDQLIHKISDLMMGQYGALFVGVCVTFACLATSIALADVCSNYLYRYVLRKKLPRVMCLILVVSLMFAMTQLGFSQIMNYAYPILKVIYPALITLCFVNILHKLFGFKYVKLPVAATVVAALLLSLH